MLQMHEYYNWKNGLQPDYGVYYFFEKNLRLFKNTIVRQYASYAGYSHGGEQKSRIGGCCFWTEEYCLLCWVDQK